MNRGRLRFILSHSKKHYCVDHETAQIARGSQHPAGCNWPPESTR